MSEIIELPKIAVSSCFALTSPPKDIAEKLNAARDAYGEQVKAAKEARQQAYRSILAELTAHPDMLPAGYRFIYWHRLKSRRIEMEIVRTSVRPCMDIWDLVYVCKDADGDEHEIYAGAMRPVPA